MPPTLRYKTRSFSLFSLIASTIVVFTAAMPSSVVRAAGDTSITPGDAVCDYPAAELGMGSAQNPFIINSVKSLSEIRDCGSRTSTITGASVTGNQVTFTADNQLGVGHSVSITGVTPSDFNVASARVVSATATTFTVQLAETLSATYTSGGSVGIDMDFYEMRAPSNAIDLISVANWEPIPKTQRITIDGRNHTIANLTVTRNVAKVGLFAELEDSNIANLSLTNVNIDQSGTSQDHAGGLLGRGVLVNIRNVSVQGLVVGSRRNIGLLAGEVGESNVSGSTSSGSVRASNTGPISPERMGGLIGSTYLDSSQVSNISDSSSSAAVEGYVMDGTTPKYGSNIGGLIGRAAGNIERTSASGNVVGVQNVGGLIGYHSCCAGVIDSTATGNVTAISNDNTTVERVGGFMGYWGCCGGISNSSASGNVTVTSQAGGSVVLVGGFLGENSCCSGFFNNHSTGNVLVTVEAGTGPRSVELVGGFVGQWRCCGSELSSSSTGDVTVVNNSGGEVRDVGGYAGEVYYEAQFIDVTSTGNVTATVTTGGMVRRVGGFVGENFGESQFVNVHSSGDVNVTNGTSVGGLIGFTPGNTQIIDSSSSGNVIATYDDNPGAILFARVGGLIGHAQRIPSFRSSIDIRRTSASGNVTVTPHTGGGSATRVGGLIGEIDDTLLLQDVYVRSSVSGSSSVGGLFGTSLRSTIDINRVYVATSVNATGTNAIVDPVSNGSFVTANASNMFDTTLAGVSTNKANFVGKTTAEMTAQATFASLGYAFDGDKPVWKISSIANGGYPTLVPRPALLNTVSEPQIIEVLVPGTTTQVSVPGPRVTIEVPVQGLAVPVVAQCVAPKQLRLSFVNGSSRLTKKASRQIRSYVSQVKSSNCSQLNIRAFYVKNSPLASSRNRVLVSALKREFWRQQYVVRLKTSIRATRGAPLERTALLSVSR